MQFITELWLKKIQKSNNRKSKVTEFLYEKYIFVDKNHTKKQLLEVIKAFGFEKKYVTKGTIIYGHQAVKLPLYYCILILSNWSGSVWRGALEKNNKYLKFSNKVINLIYNKIDEIGNNL